MATLSIRVSTQNDSGRLWPTGTWATDVQTEIGKNILGNPIHSAVRFQNITIDIGSTINSAKITFTATYDQSRDLVSKISGIDEDNTATFSSSPFSRDETTEKVDWDRSDSFSDQSTYDSTDITNIVQEIIDRGSWSSGNAMGFFIKDDGSSPNDGATQFYSYWGSSSKAPLLYIDYTAPGSTSSTPSATLSPSASISYSPSSSISASKSPSPSPVPPFFGLKIAKSGYNVLNEADPNNLIFSSDYNTLKYYLNGTITHSVNQPNATQYQTKSYIEHNLNYFPYFEVYVKDDQMNGWQPVGRFQAGSGSYRSFYAFVTKTRLYVVASGWTGIGGTGDVYDAVFKYKIFKNDLDL